MSSNARTTLSALMLIVVTLGGMSSYLAFCRQPISYAFSSTQVTANEWIVLGEVKSIDYYLSLLEVSGAAPYVQLAGDLRKLPDLTNATAVGKITFLALNATNSEVKDAFDLMIKGGTPDPRDDRYSVPSYNTELEVLYWLACQTDFKRDDTLTLAVAIVNGFWVTLGDRQVRDAVKRDATELLAFFRATNELQKKRGYSPLEECSLEAKLCLSWTGGDPARGGRVWYQLMSGGQNSYSPLNIHHLLEYQYNPIDLSGYNWNTVSISILRQMQNTMAEKGWIDRSIDSTVKNIEEYFYFSGYQIHWVFTQPKDAMITFNNEQTINHNMNNPNLVFDYYLRTGKALGVCGDEASLIESLLKSVGIPAIRLTRTYGTQNGNNHDHVVYYDQATRSWKSYGKQLDIGRSGTWNVYFFTPPAIQRNYYNYLYDNQQTWMKMPSTYYTIQGSPGERTASLLSSGIPTSQMKERLLSGRVDQGEAFLKETERFAASLVIDEASELGEGTCQEKSSWNREGEIIHDKRYSGV